MRQTLKIVISLLIALLLCGGFAVFSFTGLFGVVETTFFQRRIVEQRKEQLRRLAAEVEEYHQRNIEYFQPLADAQHTLNTFRPSNQLAREDIADLEFQVGGLRDLYPFLIGIRFLGADGRSIHYSTVSSDIENRDPNPQRRKYLDYDRLGQNISPARLLADDSEGEARAGVFIDGAANPQAFIYAFPVASAREFRGVALVYVRASNLLEYLLRRPGIEVDQVSLVEDRGIVFNVPLRNLAPILPDLVGEWQRLDADGQVEVVPVTLGMLSGVDRQGDGSDADGGQADTRDGTVEEKYNLLSIDTGRYGTFSLLIPFSVFEIHTEVKIIVAAVIFLTVFLIVYLVLNLRQDPVLILTNRVKRLQLEILKEIVEGEAGTVSRQWRENLKNNWSELKPRIKRGIGRIPADREAQLDEMIDKSWDEIIAIIEARAGEQQRQAPDIQHIEEMLQRALEGAQLTVQAPAEGMGRRSGIVVEEIGADEVLEPGEVIPSEQGEEEEERPAPVSVSDEPEELEEIEDLDEVEEIGEAVEISDLAELPDAEAAPLEEADESEPVAEVEEIEEAEPEAEEVEELEEVEEAEAAPLEEADESEPVEELERVAEIEPLPPLPQEQLEELPSADHQAGKPPLPETTVGVAPLSAGEPEDVGAAEGSGQAVEELEVAEDEAAPIESILSAGEDLVMETLPGQEQARELSLEEIERIQQQDERRQLEELLEAESIRIYTLKNIEAIIMEQRSSVVMENGVYRIKDEIVAGAEDPRKGRGLLALAKAALSETVRAGRGLETGIGALLGDESILDLETEIGQIREREATIDYASLRRSKNIHFFEDGLDYDSYLKAYRGGRTETDRLRSLVELSGKLKAVNAAIFCKDNGRYSLALKVGLSDPGYEVSFGENEPFIDMFVTPRHTVYLGESIEKIKSLAKKLHPDDLKYMQAAILFPILFGSRPAFLLLGLPVRWDLDIEDIITRLDIY